MCGIVGAVAGRDVVPVLMDGLRRLEYRGYDSAGVAVINGTGKVARRRAVGKVKALQDALQAEPAHGFTGIAHTRWATHGAPTERNAHPHVSRGGIAVVHNGIIENYAELRVELKAAGYAFDSETDTEVVAHRVHFHLQSLGDLFRAVRATVAEREGAYALVVLSEQQPDRLILARMGCPVVVGFGEHENFAASDVAALLPVTRRFMFLEEGDVAEVQRDSVKVLDAAGNAATREVRTSELSAVAAEKGPYEHFMLKEIHEQPLAVANTLQERVANGRLLEAAFGPRAAEILPQVQYVRIVACGTSYHAGVVAQYFIEQVCRIPCRVEIASEYRYRSAVVPANSLFVTISQSGETADTLAALRLARTTGYLASLAICNSPESSLVRESDLVLLTRAGPEIGVASTKAFTTQIAALALLVIALARRHGDVEGELKLKEISYIHAEAYAAGELKHGPLALVDADMPVVAVAPNNDLLEKLKSNLMEVRARGGELYVFADPDSGILESDGVHVIHLPRHVSYFQAPVVYTIPLQLLAYHVAVLRGTDVDQPRNLAKSVTVQ